MMMNIFSTFDPSSNWNSSLNWLSTPIGLLFVPPMFWLIPSRLILIWNKLINTLHLEFKIMLGVENKGMTISFVAIFSLIMFNNLLGLLPYIYTSTSQLVFTLSLALPLWLTFILMGWMNKTTNMLAHLVPLGTPPALMPFMVCIETISNIVRPGTLAIRLMANMTAGHIILTMLGNASTSIPMYMFTILLLIHTIMTLFELMVAMVQSYVFAMLSAMYLSEIN